MLRQKMLTDIPLSRVELHVHLDGSLRHETIWELAKQKNLPLPGRSTFEDLRSALIIRDPIDLEHFLKPFGIFLPTIIGDIPSIERIAYEFCEDEAKNGVAYVEARYSPCFLISPDAPKSFENIGEVVKAVYRGFTRGTEDFGVEAKQILCTLIGTGTARETLRLAEHFRDFGVVGIDTAAMSSKDLSHYEEVKLNCEEQYIFQEAQKLGIHRTVHAGEAGSAEMVRRAIESYGAERIGHGYHVLEDTAIYNLSKARNILFETCPVSSLLTGSVPLGIKKHPVVQFAEDGTKFSISSDDPSVTGGFVQSDYNLVHSWGLTEAHLIKSNVNAARASFLPNDEKQKLIKRLLNVYGCEYMEH